MTSDSGGVKNAEIFEAVCAEFYNNYFEDKWSDLPENSIDRAITRKAMRAAMNKLWSYAPKNRKAI